jgi:hypothetical protein
MQVRYKVAGAALLLMSGAALAQEDEDRGFYVGGGLGDFSADIDEISDVDDADLDFDADDNAVRLYGGWRFNRFFAVQADHYDFGRSSAAAGALSVSTDTKGFAPSVVGTLPLGPIELFARAGVVFYDLELNVDDDNNDISLDESGEDLVYSAGIGFTILERLNLKAEYEVIEISELDDADAVWISANWRF